MKKPPSPIDRHVGNRLRMRRILIGLSQKKLGDALGITFQQVQKYERGTNRIGASRLQEAARILGVPVEFFFEGAPQAEPEGVEGSSDAADRAYVSDFLATTEGVQLNRAFAHIRNAKVRHRIIDLVTAIAEKRDA